MPAPSSLPVRNDSVVGTGGRHAPAAVPEAEASVGEVRGHEAAGSS